MPALDGVGIHFFCLVFQIVYMAAVYSVTQSVAELQLRYKLEEWQIQIASQSHLQHQVCALQLYDFLILISEVYHWAHSSHQVRADVVPSLR